MAELAKCKTDDVAVVEVSDYVFGNYRGKFVSPPSADLNPKKAFIIVWKDFPFRFVFSHEASYCPWFELPGGAGVSYQFFEGNLGWAELFNQWGRQEQNSFVEIMEPGPDRVWVRWTYFGVNVDTGQRAYRATEDFWACPNGLVLRRQTYRTLLPGRHEGYTREPIELIGLCPVGKLWRDVLRKEGAGEERHALAVLDAFSSKRYDVYWTPKPGTLWDSTHRRAGCAWKEVDDAAGVALAIPMTEGAPFCVFGDASGYRHDYTRIKDHTFTDEGSEKLVEARQRDLGIEVLGPLAGRLAEQPGARGRPTVVATISQSFLDDGHGLLSIAQCGRGARNLLQPLRGRRRHGSDPLPSPAAGWKRHGGHCPSGEHRGYSGAGCSGHSSNWSALVVVDRGS